MTVIIPRGKAIENLKPYTGGELSEYAAKFNITIKGNKGWKGHVLERLAGLSNNSRQAPNGLGFELKSVAFIEKNGSLEPKETMAITMINPENVIQTDFFKSHLWEKLKSILLCRVLWTGHHAEQAIFYDMACMDLNTDGTLIEEIKQDYELVQQKLREENGFDALSGKMGKWIQPRTKGQGGFNKHGKPNKKTRAFYARKTLLKKLLETGKV